LKQKCVLPIRVKVSRSFIQCVAGEPIPKFMIRADPDKRIGMGHDIAGRKQQCVMLMFKKGCRAGMVAIHDWQRCT
jgi:hypothetical protein